MRRRKGDSIEKEEAWMRETGKDQQNVAPRNVFFCIAYKFAHKRPRSFIKAAKYSLFAVGLLPLERRLLPTFDHR